MTTMSATHTSITSTESAPTRARSVVGSTGQLAVGITLAVLYLLAAGARQDQIVLGVLALSVCVAIARPAAGLAMLVIIMPILEPDVLAPIRVNAILVGSILLGCVMRLPIDRPVLRVHPGLVLLLGYVALSAVSIPALINGHPPEWAGAALRELGWLVTGVGLFLSAAYLFHSMPSKAILGLALIGASLVALLAIGDILGSGRFEALIGGLLGDSGLSRASGTFVDPNYLGLYMAPAAVFAMGLVAIARRPSKMFLVPITLLLFACLLLTYSRGAYVGAFAGILVFVGMRSRLAALSLLIVGIVAVLTLYPAFQEARLGEALNIDARLDQAASDNSRQAIIVAAVAMFASNPLFGVGYGAFQFLSPLFSGMAATYATHSHNQYLSILAEQGIVGLAMVAGIIVLAALALRKSRSPLRQAALAMGTAYLVSAFFLHSATAFQSSCLVWLVMAAALVPLPRRTNHILEA